MKQPQALKVGFTIVELLIVIVVIGILATVTIVAWGGIQNRAHATKASGSLNVYIKALQLYKAERGHFPLTGQPVNRTVCLGSLSQYPALDGFGAGVCGYYSFDPYQVNISTQTMDALAEKLTTLPPVDWPPTLEVAAFGTSYHRGVYYHIKDINGYTATVWFVFKGSNQCPGSTIRTYNSTHDYTRCQAEL